MPALIEAVANNVRKKPFSPDRIGVLFDIFNTQGQIMGLKLKPKRLDDTPAWVRLNARGVSDGDGNLRGIQRLLTDVSFATHAVESLRMHRDQLEMEVAIRKRAELELLASRERLQQLSAHLETIREEERKQIAMEVHDELGQLLTALKMNVSLLKMHLDPDSTAMKKAEDMRALVEQTIQIVRNVASHLRPAQ